MKKFLNQTVEVKALVISLVALVLGFLGTTFLFWFNRYDIPLGVLYGGGIIAITWSILLCVKRKNNETARFDIFIIFLRLSLVVIGAVVASIIELNAHIRTLSPISLIIAYLVTSLLTLLAFIGKDKNV